MYCVLVSVQDPVASRCSAVADENDRRVMNGDELAGRNMYKKRTIFIPAPGNIVRDFSQKGH